MKEYTKFKCLISVIAVITLFFSSFSAFMVDATDGYENNTGSYNCYAYAINEIIFGEAFYYPNSNNPRYQPGDISKDYYNVIFGHPYTIDKIKCNTLRDLYALRYTDVVIYNNINDINAYNSMIEDVDFSTKELICFRVGSEDYHFMRYDSATNAWYNKSGDAPIFNFTDNNGIPSNNIPWDEAGKNYNSEITYLAFNKLQINVPPSGTWEGSITVKGGSEMDQNDNNYIYCCNDESCCNPDGICECENTVYGGKDAVYEIVVPESGCYNINLQIGGSSGFYGIIYSYNMYNGDYNIISNITDDQNFTKNIYLEASENVVNKYYLKTHFNKINIYDINISTTVTRQHMYNNHYESVSYTQHKVYCDCGDSIIENHTISGGRCTKCNETHTHEYTAHYKQNSISTHKAYCECGEYILSDHSFNSSSGSCLLCGAPHTHDYTYRYVNATKTMHRSYCICGANCLQPHVVESGSFSSGNKYALCIACKALVTIGMSYHQSIGELPHSENGSFILPDGIIVLVDEDIEAYFNGTLEFIYPDNDLEVG